MYPGTVSLPHLGTVTPPLPRWPLACCCRSPGSESQRGTPTAGTEQHGRPGSVARGGARGLACNWAAGRHWLPGGSRAHLGRKRQGLRLVLQGAAQLRVALHDAPQHGFEGRGGSLLPRRAELVRGQSLQRSVPNLEPARRHSRLARRARQSEHACEMIACINSNSAPFPPHAGRRTWRLRR